MSEQVCSEEVKPIGLIRPIIVDVNHKGYCGPRAICALTGVPMSRAEHMIRRLRRGYRDVRGRKIPIQGTYHHEVIKVLERLGCKIENINKFEPTLGRFNEDTKHIPGAFLVNVTGHYTVLSQGKCNDSSLSKPKSLIKKVWKVTAPETPKYGVVVKRQREPKIKENIIEVRYKRVAMKLRSWQTKKKRAETAIKKLTRQLEYYEKKTVASVQ